jgi:hypothetical protein
MATRKKSTAKGTEETEEVAQNTYQGGEIPHEPKVGVEERSPGDNEEAASYSTD